MAHGYHGRILEVDLSDRKMGERQVTDGEYRAYLGGSGISARLLVDRQDPHLDPLHPTSPVLVVAGLLTGSMVPTSCKASVCHRSPLTGIWNEATVGGHFPAGLRGTGVDGLCLTGASDTPVALLLEKGAVTIVDATDLWGKDTFQVADAVAKQYGPSARVLSIGPAGERLIPLASLMADGRKARAAARGGVGAVFGSKKVKAIITLGKDQPPPSHRDDLLKEVREQNPVIRNNATGLRNFGTAGGVETVEFWGDLPIKNWRLGSWKEGASRISSPNYFARTLDHHEACHACPIRCSKIVKVTEGPYAGVHSHGPEYETLGGFGGNCLCDEPEAIMAANELCNRMGIDTISASGVVAFAMEAVERGMLGPDDFGGHEVKWGQGQSIMTILEHMIEQRGAGELLSQGVREAARRMGPMAHEFAVHTKGMEYALHDPRAFTDMALQYATDPRGACHLGALTYFLGRGVPVADLGYIDPIDPLSNDNKAPMVVDMQHFLGTFNPLGLCKFLFLARVGPKQIARWVSLSTGWDMDMAELMRAGERLINLKRVYNVRLGMSRKDDSLPPRLAAHARPDGKSAGSLPHIGKMLHEYYQLRRWTEEGIPRASTLEALGLGDLACYGDNS